MMKRDATKEIMRLVLNSFVLGTATGVLVYALTLLLPRQVGGAVGEIRVLALCLTACGGLVFVLLVGAGLASLPTSLRLTRRFGLADRWPREAARSRELHLKVTEAKCSEVLASVLREHFCVLHSDQEKMKWRIRAEGTHVYAVMLERRAAEGCISLVVRHESRVGKLLPGDLLGTRILTALLIELGRRGVIPDFPAQAHQRPLGPGFGPECGPGRGDAEPATGAIRLRLGAVVRLSAVVAASVALFLGTASLEESQRVGRAARLLPLFLAAVYLYAEIVFAMRPANPRRNRERRAQRRAPTANQGSGMSEH